MLCSTLLGRWPLDHAVRFGAELVANAEQAGDNYLLNWAYWSVTWDYLTRGLISDARVWAHKLIESGHQRHDRRTLALAYWTLGWIDVAGERFQDAIKGSVGVHQDRGDTVRRRHRQLREGERGALERPDRQGAGCDFRSKGNGSKRTDGSLAPTAPIAPSARRWLSAVD